MSCKYFFSIEISHFLEGFLSKEIFIFFNFILKVFLIELYNFNSFFRIVFIRFLNNKQNTKQKYKIQKVCL